MSKTPKKKQGRPKTGKEPKVSITYSGLRTFHDAICEKYGSVYKALKRLEEISKRVTINRLSVGDKLICWAKGAGYGDTFTVQDPMYEEGMILQCDKHGSWMPLKDVDLSEYDYVELDKGFEN